MVPTFTIYVPTRAIVLCSREIRPLLLTMPLYSSLLLIGSATVHPRVPNMGIYILLLDRTEYIILCQPVLMGSEPILNMHGCTIIIAVDKKVVYTLNTWQIISKKEDVCRYFASQLQTIFKEKTV